MLNKNMNEIMNQFPLEPGAEVVNPSGVPVEAPVEAEPEKESE